VNAITRRRAGSLVAAGLTCQLALGLPPVARTFAEKYAAREIEREREQAAELAESALCIDHCPGGVNLDGTHPVPCFGGDIPPGTVVDGGILVRALCPLDGAWAWLYQFLPVPGISENGEYPEPTIHDKTLALFGLPVEFRNVGPLEAALDQIEDYEVYS
jgi:hypothetical protein